MCILYSGGGVCGCFVYLDVCDVGHHSSSTPNLAAISRPCYGLMVGQYMNCQIYQIIAAYLPRSVPQYTKLPNSLE